MPGTQPSQPTKSGTKLGAYTRHDYSARTAWAWCYVLGGWGVIQYGAACAFTAEARLSLRHDTHRPLCDDSSHSNSNGDSNSDSEQVHRRSTRYSAQPSTSQAHPTLNSYLHI